MAGGLGRGDALKPHAAWIIVCGFLLLLIPPVIAVLGAGVIDLGPTAWLERVRAVLQRPGTWRSLRFSVLQAGVSALVCVVLALPGAYYLSHYSFPGKRVVQSLSLLPFVLPSLIVILAVLSFYGRNGVLNQLLGTDLVIVYSPVGIVIAHVLFNISVGLRIIAAGWMEVDERYREVSAGLGEGPLGRLWRLHLPLLLPAILGAGGIIFLYCFVSFGIVLIFGGVRWATLEVRIYQEMFVNLNLAAAGALAALQLAVCAVLVFVLQWTSARRRTGSRRGRRFRVRQWNVLKPITRVICTIYWAAVALFFFSPLAAIVIRAFRPAGRWSTAAFTALLTGRVGDRDIHEIIRADLGELIRTSLGIALVTAALTTAVAFAAARAVRGQRVPVLDAVTSLPLAISSVTFSLGIWLLGSRIAPGIFLIWVTQSLMAFPLVFRSVRNVMDAFPLRYTESAQSLGAPLWFRIRTLEIPVLWRGLVNAFTFAFALSLSDFTAVFTIGRGEIVTFPVAMYRLIGFQSFDVALALGVWYIAIVALVFAIIDTTSYAREGQGL